MLTATPPVAGAHPRVGGEVVAHELVEQGRRGSSPRGRGGPGASRLVAPGHGLIPAWAGRSTRLAGRPTTARAHPRVGGEVSWKFWLLKDRMGSSPRGRGGPTGRSDREKRRGLIPAWAGRSGVPV